MNDDEKMLRFNTKFLVIIKHFNIISVNGNLKRFNTKFLVIIKHFNIISVNGNLKI